MSDGPEAGGWITTAVTLLGGLVVWLHKHYEDRKRKRDMDAVPPTQLSPPGPAVDAAVLRRLQRLEEHDVLTTALAGSERRVDDIEAVVQDLRRQIERLTVQRNAERAVNSLKDSLLRAKDERIVRLEEDLARARVRSRGGVIEVAAEREHRDASQAGPLSDGLPTPLRPGAMPKR